LQVLSRICDVFTGVAVGVAELGEEVEDGVVVGRAELGEQEGLEQGEAGRVAGKFIGEEGARVVAPVSVRR